MRGHVDEVPGPGDERLEPPARTHCALWLSTPPRRECSSGSLPGAPDCVITRSSVRDDPSVPGSPAALRGRASTAAGSSCSRHRAWRHRGRPGFVPGDLAHRSGIRLFARRLITGRIRDISFPQRGIRACSTWLPFAVRALRVSEVLWPADQTIGRRGIVDVGSERERHAPVRHRRRDSSAAARSNDLNDSS